MLVFGLFIAWWYARRRAIAEGVDPSHIDLAVPLVFLISILGVWLLPMISLGDALISGHAGEHQNRFCLFGLLFVAAPTLFAYCRATGLGYRRMLDLLALPAVLWLVCLRVGCFLAGCCWGDVATKFETGKSLLAAPVQTVPWLTGLVCSPQASRWRGIPVAVYGIPLSAVQPREPEDRRARKSE